MVNWEKKLVILNCKETNYMLETNYRVLIYTRIPLTQ